MCMNGNLTHLCSEYKTTDSDDITNIHALEIFVCILAKVITGNITLNVALEVLNVTEGGFTHHTLGHYTSCDGYLFTFPLAVIFLYIRAVYGHIILCDLKRVLVCCLKFCQLFTANLQELMNIRLLCLS